MNMWQGIESIGAGSQNDGLRCLVLDLNSFFASCEQQEQPSLCGLPVAVVPVMAETTCAIAASYEAKAFGIKTGTPVWEARKKCPGLKIVQARPKLYVEYHHRIIAAIESCLPIDEVMSIDEVCCRLDTVQQRPEVAHALALEIKMRIKTHIGPCLTSSIGIAANKLLAKLASNMQKPDGLVILRGCDLPRAILHLNLRAMPGIGPNMVARLQAAGIHDMAGLWSADGQRLRHIWNGIGGLKFHALLHGADIVSPARERHSIGHQHVLAPDKRRIDLCTDIIRQLLIRAGQRLRDENLFCRRLILHIKWVNHLGHYAQECCMRETQDTALLLETLMSLWMQVPRMKPLRIGIVLADLVPLARHQPDLFDRAPTKNLTSAIDSLNTKFGRGAVSYGSTMPQMVSKIAFQRVPKLKEF